ncbi:DUF5987 family protein [Micromonospora sp. NPDC005254]|uniref:DUF5987 family protein n=2 Tax=unclassified Micromonospora TaxID=2617518 RepID=UPI0036BA9EB8
MESDEAAEHRVRTMILEAFADTIIPGEKRGPDDAAIAGVDVGGGAVTGGAIELLEDPAGGLAPALDTICVELDEYAREHAAATGLDLNPDLPPFVGLPFEARTALIEKLTSPDHPDKQMWVGLALFCNMAFDSAPHLHTVDALAAGHPGLLAMRYETPDPDGLWRFPTFSYGRQLANPHPSTTATGSPA